MMALSSELRIHTWGGLGSQLFAVALLKDILKTSPKRKVTILLHTGGVTRRIPEVVDLFPEISFHYIDDFSSSEGGSNPGIRNFRANLSPILKTVLSFLKLTLSCDDDASFKKIRIWTRSIRGHYSYRTIKPEFLEMLNDRLEKISEDIWSNEGVCSIHYRLGDLLHLENKGPLAPIAVLGELDRLSKLSNFSEVEVFSDSPSRALELLNQSGQQRMSAPDVGTISVFARAIRAESFLGTSSKVSFWIAGIRSVVFGKKSSMPSRNKRELAGILHNDFKDISFYEV
jgi:hypothetical protein